MRFFSSMSCERVGLTSLRAMIAGKEGVAISVFQRRAGAIGEDGSQNPSSPAGSRALPAPEHDANRAGGAHDAHREGGGGGEEGHLRRAVLRARRRRAILGAGPRRTGRAFGSGRALRAGWTRGTSRPLGSGRARCAGRPLRTLWSSGTLLTWGCLRAVRSVRTV